MLLSADSVTASYVDFCCRLLIVLQLLVLMSADRVAVSYVDVC